MGRLLGITALLLILTGCSLWEPPMPSITTAAFEQIVWALPVGVEIRYPEITNEAPVVIFAERPSRFHFKWASKVTTAKVVTWDDRFYLAIPVGAPVRWFIVLLEDEIVELERLAAPLRYIEIFPVLP